jgi:hypothetical protein
MWGKRSRNMIAYLTTNTMWYTININKLFFGGCNGVFSGLKPARQFGSFSIVDMSVAPRISAISLGLNPFPSTTLRLAPAISKCLAILYDFEKAARCSGVAPSLSCWFRSSVQDMNSDAANSCPSSAAICSGVRPLLSCEEIGTLHSLAKKTIRLKLPLAEDTCKALSPLMSSRVGSAPYAISAFASFYVRTTGRLF